LSEADLLERLRAIVGPSHVLTDADALAGALVEPRGLYVGQARALVRPASTAEVSAVEPEDAATGPACAVGEDVLKIVNGDWFDVPPPPPAVSVNAVTWAVPWVEISAAEMAAVTPVVPMNVDVRLLPFH